MSFLLKLWPSLKLLLCYLCPFFPCSPALGKIEDGDCIFVQAFGRNTIHDEELGKTLWEILKRTSSLNETFAQLRYSGFNPGASNRALARYTQILAQRFGIPIIAQWEIVYCLWDTDLAWFLNHQNSIDCLWPPREGYYATWHVKLLSKESMLERNKKNPIEVCHPAMKARAIAIIQKTGVQPIAEPVSLFRFASHPLWVWDEASVQPWTRRFIGFNPQSMWLPREIISRFIHHPLKHWVCITH